MPRHANGNGNAPICNTQQVRVSRYAPKGVKAYREFEPEAATECPLCCEELDATEKNFFPCPCGYQVCLFCFERLQSEFSSQCPGCRTLYGTDPEEWERQAASNANHSSADQAKALERSDSRSSSSTSTLSHQRLRSRSQSISIDDTEQANRRQHQNGQPAWPSNHPQQPSPTQHQVVSKPPEVGNAEAWPSLAAAQPKTPESRLERAPSSFNFPSSSQAANFSSNQHRNAQAAADSTAPQSPGPSQVPEHDVASRPMSTALTSAHHSPAVPVPAKVQSTVNGQSVSMNVVLDLEPPKDRTIKSFVMQDITPIIQQCRQLATTMMKASQTSPSQPQSQPAQENRSKAPVSIGAQRPASLQLPPGFNVAQARPSPLPTTPANSAKPAQATVGAFLQAQPPMPSTISSPPGFSSANANAKDPSAKPLATPAPPGFPAPRAAHDSTGSSSAPKQFERVYSLQESSFFSPRTDALSSIMPGAASAHTPLVANSPTQACPLLNGFSTSSLGFTLTPSPSAKPSVNLDSLFPLAVPPTNSSWKREPSGDLEAAMQRLWAKPAGAYGGDDSAPSTSSPPQQRKPLYARGTASNKAAASDASGMPQAKSSSAAPLTPPGFEVRRPEAAADPIVSLSSALDPVVSPTKLPTASMPIGVTGSSNSGAGNCGVGPIGSGLPNHLNHGIFASHR